MNRVLQSPRFRLLGAALMALIFAAAPVFADERIDRSVLGRWQLASVLDYADITALDEKEAKHLVGKILTIEKDRVQLDNRKCGQSTFRSERVGRDRELQDNARVHDTTLGLPDPVEVVELSCAYLYLKTPNRAVLAWRGVYFDAIRLKR